MDKSKPSNPPNKQQQANTFQLQCAVDYSLTVNITQSQIHGSDQEIYYEMLHSVIYAAVDQQRMIQAQCC